MISYANHTSGCLRCSTRTISRSTSVYSSNSLIQGSYATNRRTLQSREGRKPESRRYISRVPVRLKDQQGDVSEASGQDVEWNPLLEFRKARRLAENAGEKNAPLTTPSAQILETSDTRNTSETAHESNPTMDSDEEAAIRARNEFGDELPENYLSEQQMLLYKRLYDNPKIRSEIDIEDSIEETILQRETEDGIWETIEEAQLLPQEDLDTLITSSSQDQSTDPTTEDPKTIWLEDTDYIRTHPLTLASRWGTSPSTLHFPTTTFTTPITVFPAATV